MAKSLIPPPAPSATGGPTHHSILDGIMTGLFGPDLSSMSEEDAAKTKAARHKDAINAVQMATSAWQNPGKEFMTPPTSGGSGVDLGRVIAGIGKLFKHG